MRGVKNLKSGLLCSNLRGVTWYRQGHGSGEGPGVCLGKNDVITAHSYRGN